MDDSAQFGERQVEPAPRAEQSSTVIRAHVIELIHRGPRVRRFERTAHTR